jgi:hypothetical protein
MICVHTDSRHHMRDPFRVPPPNAAHRRAFTPSERILQDFQQLKKMNLNAKVIRNLIQDVLHNSIFNPANVDHYMHDRLVRSVMDDTDVHDTKTEGNGEQDVGFFKRKVEAMLRELLAASDERLEDCQHFAFKEYKNTKGAGILGRHANGSVSF